MKTLITGGTGYLGKALIKRLRGDIRVVSRNEGKLIELKQQYPEIEILTGDIADPWIAKKAMQGVDRVFHLAAVKSVDLAEEQTFACISTNVVGTMNLLLESLNVRPALFLFVSTDKAAQVNGVYGASKLLGERLVREAESLNSETFYRIVRYGNVLGSTSSFLTKWKPRMKKGEEVCITDLKMTRFFWTREDAVDLIFECIEKAEDSTPYIPEMKGISMGKVLKACQKAYGKCPVKVIGNRGGENIHETMGVRDRKGNLVYSNQVKQYTVEEFRKKFLNK